MIRHLRHNEIDKAQWDLYLLRCPNRLWYARSCVLDAVSPGWEALVDEGQGAIMPLTTRRKWGFHYIAQPFGIQQLGLFAPQPTALLQGTFLAAIPERFRLWDIGLNLGAVGHAPAGVRLKERTNMVITLGRDMTAIRSGYSDSHARGLRKVVTGLAHSTMSGTTFAGFVLRSPQATSWNMNTASRRQFRALVQVACADGMGEIRTVTLNGVPVAAGLFVHWERRTIFLKGLSLEAGRPVRAMHHLIDRTIADTVGRSDVFDLAGGERAELRRFYAGFGAQPVLYLHALVNKLPQPLRWYKQRIDGA